jgi:hypothetical protein
LIEIEDGTFRGYAILFIFGILLTITGGPLGIYEVILGFLIKDFFKACLLALPMIITGFILTFYISRWFFK